MTNINSACEKYYLKNFIKFRCINQLRQKNNIIKTKIFLNFKIYMNGVIIE